MIWVLFLAGMGCGLLVGLVLGKVLTEREMVGYGEQEYAVGFEQGAQEGYDDGYNDCLSDLGNTPA